MTPPLLSGRDLVNMAKQRPNVIPIIEDARHPQKYRMLVPMVDVVFADVAQPDQARIVALNAQHFLKNGGNFVISIKASCIDSTAAPEAVFAREVKKLQEAQLKPREQVGWGAVSGPLKEQSGRRGSRAERLLVGMDACVPASQNVLTRGPLFSCVGCACCRSLSPPVRRRCRDDDQRLPAPSTLTATPTQR
jgi:hypothetical protein